MPIGVVLEIDHSLARWLEKVASNIDVAIEDALPIVELLLSAESNPNSLTNNDGEPIGEPIFEAINHPIGQLTTALVALWYKENPMDGDGLPAWLASNLELISNSKEPRLRHGKTIVAQHLIALYRVDPEWTRSNLCLLYTSPSPRDATLSRMPSSA